MHKKRLRKGGPAKIKKKEAYKRLRKGGLPDSGKKIKSFKLPCCVNLNICVKKNIVMKFYFANRRTFASL